MSKIPVIIDCDPGVDDALAIILALKHPDIDVKAICTVTGNVHIEYTTKNGLNILALCGRKDIPLYRGSEVALDQERPETVPAFGNDGLGGFAHTIESDKLPEEENAVDYLIRASKEHPGELTLLAIGPYTNVAKAIRKDPMFPKRIKQIILMGGAKYTGNMSPVAEYNFWADPQAAKEVLAAGFERLVMVGLDVTNQIALDAGTREILRILNTDLSKFIYNITQSGLDENWEFCGRPVSPMHDVLTVGYLIDPSILTVQDAHIDAVTDGIARGQSVVDIGGYWNACNAEYASDVDTKKFYKLFLTSVFPEHREDILRFLAQ